jgi:hypothetical protein
MQIVRLQCPACGAAFTVPASNASVVCEYCGTRFAIGSDQVAPLETPEPVSVAHTTASPAWPPPGHAATSTGRGCVAALIALFVLAPLIDFLVMLPLLPFLPEDAAGKTQIPDAIALCLALFWFVLPPALAIYAFVYFRRPHPSIGGFFIAPFRRLFRLIRRK